MFSARTLDHIMTIVIWAIAGVVIIIPLAMVYELLNTGIPLLSWQFLLTEPVDAGRSGGIAPLIVSTGLLLFVCLSVVIPIGLSCAVYLHEFVDARIRTQRYISQALDILSATPSIIFGLFGYVLFAQWLGFGFSLLSGGLSLACMVLPLFVRLVQQALYLTPIGYKNAAEALNLSHSGYIFRILLPNAASGIAAAVIISVGRALAETAVLIFTAGYVTRQPESLLDSGRSLSVHIYDLAMNVSGGAKPAAATALVLMGGIVLINIAARSISKRWLPR